MYYTIKWNGDSVSILNQKLLPVKEVYNKYTNYRFVINAIRDMEVRGAPAIGVTAAMGIALAAKNITSKKFDKFKNDLLSICDEFAVTRPTAVNLVWAVDRMKKIIKSKDNIENLIKSLEKEAIHIYEEDIKINRNIGKKGQSLLSDGDVVMTHCNAGSLATAGYGTALGIIRAAVEEGKNIKVFACETRPFLQGARLTTWELMKDNIPVTLITDNMAGYFMKNGTINKIIVGADRVALNGDTANKIGTYTHSVLAKHHNIPFYVAAPESTLDPDTKTGDEIVIEERHLDEVVIINNEQIAPEGVSVMNPAFDVTPAENITAIITENSVIENPGDNGISWVL